ncbi:hypothetical protein P154DRAFT_569168 [Amniculicola lignicola CBS 123094]|uniref:Cora-domain-containing protein n=1 Tax=Amniculicola lignicola CBS 123094 TaxID=1392246 RepID=A0A6A5WZM3_9PLEO|nr:hypothetical protein P154DRAFT_569168 [Amniculicola lignicola CBS 123094]
MATPPPNTTASVKSKAKSYQDFVAKLASRERRFVPLSVFLSSASTSESKIYIVEFCKDDQPKIRNLEERALETELEKDIDRQLYIVENGSSTTMKLLGAYCNVDPQLFVDYLDMVQPTISTPKRSNIDLQKLEPLPWYRLGDVENHLPPLRSAQQVSNHVHIRFIGPREYWPENGHVSSQPVQLPERLESDGQQNNPGRIAGAYHPIHAEEQKLWPVAMARHSAGAWFNNGAEWRKGIILLDAPFDIDHAKLSTKVKRQNSTYRSFIPQPVPKGPFTPDIDSRESYTTSLLHCLAQNADLRHERPHPICALQDLYRIVASEWIAVNTYLERDLNAIEWRLEGKTPSVATLDFFLSQLFIMRRRTRKYETLVDDHLQTNLPSSWLSPGSNQQTSSTAISTKVLRSIESDLAQVQVLIHRNNDRITQTVSLITSLMAVIEGKRARTLNQRLAFLTVLATIALPFNVLAAILGIQTVYGPGQKEFWVFGAVAGAITGVVLICYAVFLVLPNIREKKVRAKMM